jgi:hypothetical protein
LERFLLERNWLSEILAKGTDPCSIREESSGTAAAANTDLQQAVKLSLIPDLSYDSHGSYELRLWVTVMILVLL